MLLRHILKLIAGVFLLVQFLSSSNAEASDPTRPNGPGSSPAGFSIWWSPVIGLKHINDIDSRLAAPFDDAINESHDGQIVQATDCRSLLALRAKGFEPRGDWAYAQERYLGARCLALKMLKTAEPARTSNVADFRLSPAVVDILPPTLSASFSTLEDDAGRKAESKGMSWQKYQPNLKAHMEKDVLVVRGDTWQVRVQIYARADFDGDGKDDLLVSVNEIATQGTFDNTKLLLLSRIKSNGKFVTVKRLQ